MLEGASGVGAFLVVDSEMIHIYYKLMLLITISKSMHKFDAFV